jgi:SAM-dependent methyltransferase
VIGPNASDKWNEEIGRERAARKYPKWPNEVMLKVLFGGNDYLTKPYKPSPDWRVLDVGCGFANNLVPFADIGCECHGVDLHVDMAAAAQAVMDERGFKTKIQAGSNRSLPFEDGYFDLLLSVNTLHYEGTYDNVIAALTEFRRVLKPGGGLYISTAGPDHELCRRAAMIADHRYRIENFDFRDGEVFFFFESERYLLHCCEKVFKEVETGRVTEKLMNLPLDFLIGLCR